MGDEIDNRGLRNLHDAPGAISAGRVFVFSDADLEAALEDYRQELIHMGMDETETKGRCWAVRAFFQCEGRARASLIFQPARDIPTNKQEGGYE